MGSSSLARNQTWAPYIRHYSKHWVIALNKREKKNSFKKKVHAFMRPTFSWSGHLTEKVIFPQKLKR